MKLVIFITTMGMRALSMGACNLTASAVAALSVRTVMKGAKLNVVSLLCRLVASPNALSAL